MDVVVILLFLAMAAAAFGCFGAWIAGEKGRPRGAGALVGFLFGPLGCLVLVLLPGRPAEPTFRKVRSFPAFDDGNWEMSDSPPASATRTWHSDKDEDRALHWLSED